MVWRILPAIDYVGGIESPGRHVIRLIGNPETYRKDPVRRCARSALAAKDQYDHQPGKQLKPLSSPGRPKPLMVPPARVCFEERVLKLFAGRVWLPDLHAAAGKPQPVPAALFPDHSPATTKRSDSPIERISSVQVLRALIPAYRLRVNPAHLHSDVLVSTAGGWRSQNRSRRERPGAFDASPGDDDGAGRSPAYAAIPRERTPSLIERYIWQQSCA